MAEYIDIIFYSLIALVIGFAAAQLITNKFFK